MDQELVMTEGVRIPSIKEVVSREFQTAEAADSKYYNILKGPLNVDLEDIFSVKIVEGKAVFSKLEKSVVVEVLPSGEKVQKEIDPIADNLLLLSSTAKEIFLDETFISDEDLRDLVKHAYLSKINEKIAIWTIGKNYVSFMKGLPEWQANGEFEKKSQEFALAQKALFKFAFGQPNKEYLDEARSNMCFELDRIQTDISEVKSAIDRVKEIIGWNKSMKTDNDLTPKQVEIFRKAVSEPYVIVTDTNKVEVGLEDKLLTQSEHAELVRKIWKENGMLAFGYAVVEVDDSSSSSVSHDEWTDKDGKVYKGKYKVGTSTSPIKQVFQTVVHESLHVAKRIYGEDKLKLFGSGSFAYLAAEESVTQTAEVGFGTPERPDIFNSWRYIVAGLVWGLEKNKPDFGFNDSFELAKLLFFIESCALDGMSVDKAREYAEGQAVRSNIRNFRGAPIPLGGVPEIKGVCSTKDTVYLHGLKRLKKFISGFKEDLSNIDLRIFLTMGKTSYDTASDMLLHEKLGLFKLPDELRKRFVDGLMVVIRGQDV